MANGEAGVGTLIDPKSRTVVATIPLGGKPEFPALDPESGLLYQNLNDTNSIAALDLGQAHSRGPMANQALTGIPA